MLKLDLRSYMKAREIEEPMRFLRRNGFSSYTASRLLHNVSDSISYRNLEKLCLALHCTPDDLFIWSTDNKTPEADKHPLRKLQPKQSVGNLNQAIKRLPLDKLHEVKKFIEKLENGE